MLNFKEWLKLHEIGTSTSGTGSGDIAMFKRPIFGDPVRRRAILGVWNEEDPFFKRKKLEHGMDPTAYGSVMGSDPDGQSLPQYPIKAQANMAASLDGGQPSLSIPMPGVKEMKKKSKK